MSIIKKITEVIKGKPIVVKNEIASFKCLNCNDSGHQCSSCSSVFKDTFGE